MYSGGGKKIIRNYSLLFILPNMRSAEREGTLIVVCGIDGSGKTLQCKKLHSYLQRQGVTAQYVEFPRYNDGFFGELIAKYLRGEMGDNAAIINPYMASLPFACDRWEFSATMRSWLEEGYTIICNRYVSANMAHQGGKIESKAERKSFYDWIEKMEYQVFGIPKPNMYVWLDILPKHAIELIGHKGERNYLGNKDDIHENYQHLETARKAYEELAGRGKNWIKIKCSGIDGVRPPQEISRDIYKCLTSIGEN